MRFLHSSLSHHDPGLFCNSLPLCLRSSCYSCSQSQRTQIFFSFHTIWLKTSGNLDVSFGIFDWELKNCEQEVSPLAQDVFVVERKGKNRVDHGIVQKTMAVINPHWTGRKEETWRFASTSENESDRRRCVPCARCCLVWGFAVVVWSILSRKSLQRAKQCRLFLARLSLAYSDSCFKRGALG